MIYVCITLKRDLHIYICQRLSYMKSDIRQRALWAVFRHYDANVAGKEVVEKENGWGEEKEDASASWKHEEAIQTQDR